jgi:hypothetical protein
LSGVAAQGRLAFALDRMCQLAAFGFSDHVCLSFLDEYGYDDRVHFKISFGSRMILSGFNFPFLIKLVHFAGKKIEAYPQAKAS